ncbi:MAG: hypothetical protein IT208_15005, partial [Chthonomonadales bacterium]|nr:hypothetical protein [Chthonomonadales bacterium]
MKLAWQLAAALLALTGPMPDARAQAPVPLPTDPSLAAYVASSGAFQSQSLGQQRTLTLRAWMAAYAAGESI